MNTIAKQLALGLALLAPPLLACATSPAPAPAPEVSAPAPLVLAETAPTETPLRQADLPEALDVWLDMIDGATEALDIAQFYIVDGPGGRLGAVLDRIAAAAARGVRVRVLAEDRFAAQYPDALAGLAALSGVEVVIWDTTAHLGGILHAKYFIVDRRDAWLGSHNFDWRALEHIRELGLRVRVPEVVRALSDVFETDWALAGGGPAEARVHSGAGDRFPVTVELDGAPVAIRPALSPRGWLPDESTWDLPQLVAMIDGATDSVRVELLSYEVQGRDGDAFTELDDALRRAGSRGVTVQLMVAHWNQRAHRVGALQSLQRSPGVEVRLMTIPEASAGFIPFARVNHTKLLVVDGVTAWLGTSNWGRSYFYASRNVGVILEGRAVGARLDAYFLNGWDSPYAETVDPERDYPAPRIAE